MPETTDYSLLDAALEEGQLIKKGRFYFTSGEDDKEPLNVAGTKDEALAYLAQVAADQADTDETATDKATDKAATDKAAGQQGAPKPPPAKVAKEETDEAEVFPGGKYFYGGNVRLDYTASGGVRGVLQPFTTYSNLPAGSPELLAAVKAGKLRKLK